MRHGVPQVGVVLDGMFLEQGQHRGAVLRRVQDQDQHAHVCGNEQILIYELYVNFNVIYKGDITIKIQY